MTIQLHASLAVHPGPWLRRNMVEPYRLHVSQAANPLQVSRAAMSNLLNGHADPPPERAVSFEKALGVSAATLLTIQAASALAPGEAAATAIKEEREPDPDTD